MAFKMSAFENMKLLFLLFTLILVGCNSSGLDTPEDTSHCSDDNVVRQTNNSFKISPNYCNDVTQYEYKDDHYYHVVEGGVKAQFFNKDILDLPSHILFDTTRQDYYTYDRNSQCYRYGKTNELHCEGQPGSRYTYLVRTYNYSTLSELIETATKNATH